MYDPAQPGAWLSCVEATSQARPTHIRLELEGHLDNFFRHRRAETPHISFASELLWPPREE